MKNWKALIAGFLVFCLLSLAVPYATVRAEEGGEEQETEEPIPESYYYEIESNNTPGWPQGPAIEAAAATVMDMDTGVFLYSKNATAKMYPASITKIMTTLILVETCDLDEEITFSEIVYDLEEGSSHLGVQPGETMTLRDAAYGIMLASANDMANGVAEYIGGSIEGFADIMNARAEELGCVNTHFANPHGLYQEDHYTCAYDMALIAQAAYANPVFREIVTAKEYTIPVTNLTEEERSFQNHHKMMQSDEEYYRDWCTGGKTGYTSDCLNTLVTYAEKDGKSLVSVILRVNGAGKAYNESTQILEYGFENFYTNKFETGSAKCTFYDIMGLGYLGEASNFQASAWKQVPMTKGSGSITLPNTVKLEDLTYQITAQNGTEKVFSYEYNGYPVGTSEADFRTIFAPIQIPYLVKSDKIKESVVEAVPATDIQINSLDDVLSQTTEFFETGYRMFQAYTEEHTLTVIAGGFILLILLIVFIVILIFRCTAESRIKRRRRQEEEERKKREAEIERMTAAEIEAELRAVMEQEQMRKEQERIAQEEAERAAQEARMLDEKAHETEQLLDELEKERQERLASKK